MQKDNSTFKEKIRLRSELLAEVAEPCILETHGGLGKIYQAVYADCDSGIVFEKDPEKIQVLAAQRPTWSVYEADCIKALSEGAGNHLSVNFLDVDPYGMCWPTLDAFFQSDRPRVKELRVAVNCGLKQTLNMKGGWHVGMLTEIVKKYGNEYVCKNYLNLCPELLETIATGYHLADLKGYYCGHAQAMTHFRALLWSN